MDKKHDPKIKTNTRNLRIREDTAKYLLNLNEDSAYYDGKSHSMRENPNATSGDQTFKGDNFARLTGDAAKLLEQEKFMWDLIQKEGAEVYLILLEIMPNLFLVQLNSKSNCYRNDLQESSRENDRASQREK